jgi:hypothetical protein
LTQNERSMAEAATLRGRGSLPRHGMALHYLKW